MLLMTIHSNMVFRTPMTSFNPVPLLQKATLTLIEGVMNGIDRVFIPLQRRIGTQRMAYLFVLPNLIVFGVFILLPMILNFSYAATGSTNLLLQDRPYVGGENFEVLLSCDDFRNLTTCEEDVFWRAVSNTIQFVVFQVGAMVLFALVTALALNRRIKWRGFFRSVFFYPVLLSPVVVALIWRWILQRDGLLNAFLISTGGTAVDFFINSDWARFWVIFVSVWAQMGFYTLILLAGLQAIPHEYNEAAQIDGASDWQILRNVTLPLLSPTLLVVIVLSLIRSVQVFDQAYALTGGGPGTSTTYIVQYIYNTGFTSPSRQAGLAAAASVLLAAVLMILTALQLVWQRTAQEPS